MKEGGSFMPRIKDSAIFTAWIAGLCLAGILCWFLTQEIRANFLMRSVNRALAQIALDGQPLSLGKPLAFRDLPPETTRMGTWYTLEDPEGQKGLVFTIIADGSFLPCLAVVSPEGPVERIVPLNRHSEKLLDRVSPGVLGIYIRRIEGGSAKGGGKP
ncbi:MAG: hypothetical protein LBC62_01580 [Treponema sp.]|jgi:hypothetical protein|nr:hypothetical protein [Treponema sp.]